MPELPEVETIKLQLEKRLVGCKIIEVDIRTPKSFPDDEKLIIGAKIKALRRFGKVVVIDLDNKYSILVHLKLTGQLLVNGNIGPHTRVILNLDKGKKLIFNDLRIFGWMKIVKNEDVLTRGFIGKLGPEPFRDLTFKLFKETLSKTTRPIKIVLMDQEKISGIGNIYAVDGLWLAGIDPKRKANDLSLTEQQKLYKAVLKVLKDGIKFGGASDQHYVKPDGTKGEYQDHFLVYGRQGELCLKPACRKEGIKIKKYFLGGRGTYFCPNCQK